MTGEMQKIKQKKLENSAKNKENPHKDSQDITAEIDTIKRIFWNEFSSDRIIRCDRKYS